MMAPNAHVYFFAHMLSAEDVVTDGREGKPFSIDNDTFFVWIDLQPSAKFAHPTRYVFISAQDVRIQDGLWWPVVNGVSHFDHNRPMASPCTPFDLAFSTGGSSKRAEVYVYPYLLSSHAKLTDGPSGKPFSLEGNSLLIWIDRQPGFRFVHDTRYVLISAGRVDCIDGGWWPVLEGRRILCGDTRQVAFPLPIVVEPSSK